MPLVNTHIGNIRLEPLLLHSPISDNPDQLLSEGFQVSNPNSTQSTTPANISTQMPINSDVRQSSNMNRRQEGRRRQRRRKRQRTERPNELQLSQRQQLSQQTRNQRSRT